MNITREMIVRDVAEKTGFYLKDIRSVLSALDELVKEYYMQVTDDEEIKLQIVEGVKIGAHIQQPRMRVDPRNQNPVLVKATVKPFARFSDDFRQNIQDSYEKRTN